MSARAVRSLRAVGAIVVVSLTAAALQLGDRYPILVSLAAVAAWLQGKLLGVPIDDVVGSALQTMNTAKRVQITVHSVNTLPPDAAKKVIESIPPTSRDQLIDFVDSLRPPAQVAKQTEER